jgi:hypothetical protein
MRTAVTEQYEDDFEDERDDRAEVVEEMSSENGDGDGTLRLARQQAEARSRAHADAHQRRLAALAYAHFSGPAGAPADAQPETPRRPTSHDYASSDAERPPAERPPARASAAVSDRPPPNLGSVRHAALQVIAAHTALARAHPPPSRHTPSLPHPLPPCRGSQPEHGTA